MAKILITEDEKDIRDLVIFTLKFAGHTVVSAKDGAEGWQMAVQEKPDLILMDVRMPRMTGYEACQKIKAEPDLKEIPLVFLSAKGQDAEIRTGMELGAEEYLLKPFGPTDLIERVRIILARYGKT